MKECLNTRIYPFKHMENKWRGKPLKKRSGPRKYILEMLPYPSGDLHMGHVRNYTIVDILTRFYHLSGYNIMRPLGWDSFGLPAEVAAIERNIHPKTWTNSNIAQMKSTLCHLNYAIDWSHEISTCDFNYYKHQQQLFKEFYKKGYVIKKEEWINWDPQLKTVLANEQVINGKGWRSGATVERKKISQWFFNISKYSEKLLNDIDSLEEWPSRVKKMQQQWIGKYEGYSIIFSSNFGDLEIFTTRPDTIYGVTFLVASAECKYLTRPAKHGDIIGTAIHPYTQEELPIFVADYVISDHGTGVVMGVPAADDRDFAFAKEFGLKMKIIYNDDHKLINSQELNGLTKEEACAKFPKYIGYKLRDWCISRQRYWGCPIPIIYCEKCGTLCAEGSVELPDDVTFDQGNPLESNESWVNVKCHECGGNARRETDTMDTFVDSAWYFLRYVCALDDKNPLDIKVLDEYLPVDTYVGGVEHAILHLLYSRFFMIMLKDLGYVNTIVPFKRLITQGMVCYNTYRGKTSGKYYYPYEVRFDNGKWSSSTEEVIEGSPEKMSKSLRNTVSPMETMEAYGVDSLRLFIISDSPTDKDFFWNTNALFGCYKFMNRIWVMNDQIKNYENSEESNDKKFANYVKGEILGGRTAIENCELNIYVARLRMAFNDFDEKMGTVSKKILLELWKEFLILLWPVCPSIAQECYEEMYCGDISEEILRPMEIVKSEELTVVLQVNGIFKKSYKTFDFNEDVNKNLGQNMLNISNFKDCLYIKQDFKHIINFLID